VTLDALFSTPAVLGATDERALVAAMLDVEAALTRACALVGLIPADAATAIVAACRPDLVDAVDVWASAATSATPVIALVEALRAAVPPEYGPCVHYGATSQDIVDTALMLVAATAVAAITADLADAGRRLAALATEHADAPQRGRTLMRPAAPTTFGALCAAWRDATGTAEAGLRRWRPALQLGGVVGTRAELAPHADRVVAAVAADLGLDAVPPWHTDRTRVVELATGLGIAAGTLAKVAGDVILLSQAEIGELGETTPGGSSALAGKRNPARAVLVVSCAHRTPGLVSTLLASMPQELQRAAGRWQAEWPTLVDLLRVVAGAAHHARVMLDDLTVDTERMASRA
jgi:3-carboxy-cis,cis-muconate cycloisomerase